MLIRIPMHKGEPHPVDHRVGQHRGDQLPAQAMVEQIIAEGFHQFLRKVMQHVLVKERIIGDIRRQQGIEQRILGIGQQHRQFRAGQPFAAGATFAE